MIKTFEKFNSRILETVLWSDNYLVNKIIKKVEQGKGRIEINRLGDEITYTYNKGKPYLDIDDPYSEEVYGEDVVVIAIKDEYTLPFPVYHVEILNNNDKKIKLNSTNGRKLYKALIKRYKEEQLGDILEESMSNDEFYVLIKHNNKKAIISISKYDGRWRENYESGYNLYGIGKAYIGNMTPEQIVDNLKRNYDYAKLLTDEEILDYI